MKRLAAALVIAVTLTASTAATTWADNPHSGGSTGQPSKSCQDFFSGALTPNGFNTTGTNANTPSGMTGFANAGTVYAGSGTHNSNNPQSVSQYDVACFQAFMHSGG